MNSSTLRYLHANQQGSITLTGDSSGGPLRTLTYDEYGVAKAADAALLTPGTGARFLYTGQMLVPELAMYYYKARIYSPQLGRFMQTDPIGYRDQINLYGYVGNDPVNGVDPTGLYDCGDEAACDAAARARSQLQQALRNAEDQNKKDRSPQGDRAVSALRTNLSDLGTKNDGNGLKVATGDLPGNEAANYTPDGNGKTGTITYDLSQIRSSNFSIGAFTAHELSHYEWDKKGWGVPSLLPFNEIAAYARQFLTQSYTNGWSPINPGLPLGPQFEPYVTGSKACGGITGPICHRYLEPYLRVLDR